MEKIECGMKIANTSGCGDGETFLIAKGKGKNVSKCIPHERECLCCSPTKHIHIIGSSVSVSHSIRSKFL